jgi:hypothetical protein
MPLLDFLEKGRDTVLAMSASQVLSIAGDGNLKDDSYASHELREFLTRINLQQLEKYAQDCLTEKIPSGGLFLQDIVNELGRRLENTVDYGLYRGGKGKIGYDGLWTLPEGHNILVEVKSSTTYTIDFDRITSYRDKLKENHKIGKYSSILFVVGNEDTNSLEAQIRGSRYAWDMRIISVDSLIKLTKIKESTEEEATLKKIIGLLVPIEYTKLDCIIDIMFTTTSDIEESMSTQDISISEVIVSSDCYADISYNIERTSKEIIEHIKQNIINTVGKWLGVSFHAKSRALHLTKDGQTKLLCAVSKRYPATYAEYWYTYRLSHKKFFEETKNSYIALGCTDSSRIFLVPADNIENILPSLNCTESKTGNKYWHLCIAKEDGNFVLVTQKDKENIPLNSFLLPS